MYREITISIFRETVVSNLPNKIFMKPTKTINPYIPFIMNQIVKITCMLRDQKWKHKNTTISMHEKLL